MLQVHVYISHTLPCNCVHCSVCDGTGYMPSMSKPSDFMGDDYSDPIPCYACVNGISAQCEACEEREMLVEIEQPGDEDEEEAFLAPYYQAA